MAKIEKSLMQEKISKRDIIILFFISLCAFILKYKGFPRGESHPQLAGIYRAVNPSYLKNDFYVNAVSSFDVTTWFEKLINLVNYPIQNYEITYMLLLFLSMFVFAVGFYKIMLLLTKNSELSLFSAIIPLSIYTSRLGIGNSFELGNYLVPTNIAWAIAIWAIYFFLKEKYIAGFFILGITSMFHILLGLLIYGLFFLNLLFTKKFKFLLQSLSFFIPFLVIAIPLFINSLKTSIADSSKIIYIYAAFRSPWHILPATWPLIDWLTFLSFFIFFLILFYKFSKIDKKYKNIFEVFLISVLIYYLLGIIFVEIMPLKSIVKLQLFRITEFLNLIEFIFIGEFLYFYIYSKLSKKIKIAIITLLIILVASFLIFNPLFERYHYDKQTSELYSFIKTSTPEDAIILAPPHIESFRWETMRAVVADFKSVPFGEKPLVEWYTRIMEITNNQKLDLAEERSFKLNRAGNSRRYDSLKIGYNSLTKENILSLKERYNFSYAVFEKPFSLNLTKFFENDKYIVYKVSK